LPTAKNRWHSSCARADKDPGGVLDYRLFCKLIFNPAALSIGWVGIVEFPAALFGHRLCLGSWFLHINQHLCRPNNHLDELNISHSRDSCPLWCDVHIHESISDCDAAKRIILASHRPLKE